MPLAQSCPTLCNPMDCRPPDSSAYGVFQAGILEWVASFYSRGSSWLTDWTLVSYISCIGRRILYHFAPWEALKVSEIHLIFGILESQYLNSICCCSGAQLCPPLWPQRLQHARPPCPVPPPGACSNSCPLSLWCHQTTSSSVIPFSCLLSFPESRYFPNSIELFFFRLRIYQVPHEN